MKTKPILFALLVLANALLGAICTEACDCPGENDTARFAFGGPTLVSGGGGSGSIYSVPLLCSSQETATFTQLTVVFDPELVAYVEESAVVGGDVGGTSSITEFPDTGTVTFQVIGTWTGCTSGGQNAGRVVAVAQFQKLETSAAPLAWDETEGGPNSLCHVNYTQHHGLDGKITPTDICFDDGATGKAAGDDTATEPVTWTTAKRLFQ